MPPRYIEQKVTIDDWQGPTSVKFVDLNRDRIYASSTAVPAIDVQCFHNQPGALTVLYYDSDRIDVSDVARLSDNIKTQHPDIQILALPKFCKLVSMSTDRLKEIRDRITEMIEASDFDHFAGAP